MIVVGSLTETDAGGQTVILTIDACIVEVGTMATTIAGSDFAKKIVKVVVTAMMGNMVVVLLTNTELELKSVAHLFCIQLRSQLLVHHNSYRIVVAVYNPLQIKTLIHLNANTLISYLLQICRTRTTGTIL